MAEATEMGWNDILGNLRRARATPEEKQDWCRGQKALAEAGHNFGPTQNSDEYREGVIGACAAFLASEEMAYQGPEWVVERMLAAE